MKGRRMLWTTLIGAAITLAARMMKRRQSPMRRMIRRFGWGNQSQWWMRLVQPLKQMGRRMAR